MKNDMKLPPMQSPELMQSKESWRVFGIMSEFVSATERLRDIHPAVSIFGSARTPHDHPYYKLTEEIARLLSDAGFAVISGGGPGVMEAANKGAFYGKSASVGLNIQLPHEQHTNPYQNVSQTFHHFFTRKVMFVKFASAYVVMPGGFGTMDELMEALTLVQTGKTRKHAHHPGRQQVLGRHGGVVQDQPVGGKHDRGQRHGFDSGHRRTGTSGRRHIQTLRNARFRAFRGGTRDAA